MGQFIEIPTRALINRDNIYAVKTEKGIASYYLEIDMLPADSDTLGGHMSLEFDNKKECQWAFNIIVQELNGEE